MKNYFRLSLILFLLITCSKDEVKEECINNPSFSSSEISEISYTSFLISGTITPPTCDPSVISQGVVYSEEALPTADDNQLKFSGTTYQINVTGLKTGTTYYIRPFYTNVSGEYYGSQKQVSTLNSEIEFYDGSVSKSISTAEFETRYRFSDGPGFVVTSKGFEINGSDEISDSTEDNYISIIKENLEPNSTINYRPFVVTEYGKIYGNLNNFNTDDPSSSIDSFIIENISFTEANASVEYSNNYEGEDITQSVGIILSEDAAFTSPIEYLGTRNGLTFTANLDNLTPGTTYYVKAFVTNEFLTTNSLVQEFNTLIAGYNFNTLEYTGLSYDGVELNSTYNQIQGSAIAVQEKGFYLSQSESTLENFKYTSNSGDDLINRTINDLSAGTKYYFQAFITNEYGTFKSNISSFTTNDASPVISSTADAQLDFADLSFNFSFKPNTTNSSIILEYVDIDNNLENSEQLDNSQEVQNITLINLLPNTNYQYRVILTNQYGTFTGDYSSFKTLDDTPTISISATKSGDNEVLINAEVIPSPSDTNITRVYLEYFNPETSVTSIELDPNTLTYNFNINDLTQGPGYTFRLVVINTYNTFNKEVYFTLPVTYSIGDIMFGGIIVDIDQTGYHGLVATQNNSYTNLAWSTDYTPIDLRSNIFKDGAFNTNQIISLYAGSPESAPAAEYCNNLVLGVYNDWFLPSYDELEIVSKFLWDNYSTPGSIGYIRDRGYIWSSSTDFNDTTKAMSHYEAGSTRYYDRSTLLSVIPVRRF
ncbi:DUF1566 domain-containing protein [Eudoraea adriatica]|uniref:DUF1566 domain-containing protein n=1 Tax=Eudoraea adriatica TaxID=446681 RepID=UPI00036E1975|nr:DUF1566 domain-containing protein [Eudoraea adriatica]